MTETHLPRQTGLARLILGTAQLGMAYGIANRTALETDEKIALLHRAHGVGLTRLDTARAYGRSESVIGSFIAETGAASVDIVTKLSPLTDLEATADADRVDAAVMASVRQSQDALRINRLPKLLLHRAEHLDAWGGQAWRTLRRLREAGTIGLLGVSVQNPTEVLRALEHEAVEYLQIPFNLMDDRWTSAIAAIERARSHRRLEVAVRSIYLQGLLLSEDANHWQRAHVDPSTDVRSWLSASAKRLGRSGIDDLCLAYVAAHTWVDGIVIGIDNEEQLARTVALAGQTPLTEAELAILLELRPRVAENTLDPSQWRRAAGAAE